MFKLQQTYSRITLSKSGKRILEAFRFSLIIKILPLRPRNVLFYSRINDHKQVKSESFLWIY